MDRQTDKAEARWRKEKTEDCLLQKDDNLSDAGFSKNGITMKQNLQNTRKFYIQ